jgi:hypothetical protein
VNESAALNENAISRFTFSFPDNGSGMEPK